MNKRIKFIVNNEEVYARSSHEAAKVYAVKKHGRGTTAFPSSLNKDNCFWVAFKKDKNENWLLMRESFTVQEPS